MHIARHLSRVVKKARYDAALRIGRGTWGYVCEEDFEEYGIGLGTGVGQILIMEGETSQVFNRPTSTKYALAVSDELTMRGIVHTMEEFIEVHPRPGGFFYADIWIPSVSLDVEIDGRGHDDVSDRNREYLMTTVAGINLIRFKNSEVYNNLCGVVDAIVRKCVDLAGSNSR